MLDLAKPYAQSIVDSLNASPCHFHAVQHCKNQLKAAGFTEIREVDKW
jgi:aspartyl aminopeptidase